MLKTEKTTPTGNKNNSRVKIDWTKIKEVMVNKDNVNVLNIKKSHLDAEYQKISLNTLPDDILNKSVPNLKIGSVKLNTKI